MENFPHTYLVGGYVRDFLLGKKSLDIDICTTAKPEEIEKTLLKCQIPYNKQNINFGIITIKKSRYTITISTLRKELYTHSRYPKIHFIKSLKQDAQRRDFTVNSLYLNPNTGKMLDYYHGRKDLLNHKIKFIGQPKRKILEDPLRILRGIRLGLNLKFKFDSETKLAIIKNFFLIRTLSPKIILNEIHKIKNFKTKTLFKTLITNPKMLDKYF